MKELSGLFSLCRKAGRLQYGFDTVVQSVKRREARLVVVSRALSDKTQKEIAFFTAQAQVETITTSLSLEEMDFLLGKRTGIIAILDAGFARRVKELLTTVEKGR